MDTCLMIEKFRNDLIEIVNNSNLTIGTALFIYKDIYNDLYKEYQRVLELEQKEENFTTSTQEISVINEVDNSDDE